MNGKKAKALRRIASQQTVGFSDTTLAAGFAHNVIDAKCTRGVVNHFKREIKRGALSLRKGA